MGIIRLLDIGYIGSKTKNIKFRKTNKKMKLTREQLIECYDCVFDTVHSDGFKAAEMADLIYDITYRFLEKPKEGWEVSLRDKLAEMGFNLDELR